jgi:hypothetical protein
MYKIECTETGVIEQLKRMPTLNINGIDFRLVDGLAISDPVQDHQLEAFQDPNMFQIVNA